MKYLKNYKIFEALFRDSFKNDYFSGYTNKVFVDDVELIKTIYLDSYHKDMTILWNHKIKHDIIEKIETRTQLKSITEFNEIMFKVINELFNNHLDFFKEQEKILSKYNMIFLLRCDYFNLIIRLHSQKIYNDDASINVITLLPKTTAKVDFEIDLRDNDNIY